MLKSEFQRGAFEQALPPGVRCGPCVVVPNGVDAELMDEIACEARADAAAGEAAPRGTARTRVPPCSRATPRGS